MALPQTSPLLDDDELQKIYVWVDSIPLSRAKKNIARDFSDGVLMAEVVHHYFPKLVELHNYSSANSHKQKMYNWATLNRKVFRRLNFEVSKDDVDAIVACKPGMVEAILMQLQHKIAEYRQRKPEGPGSPGEGAGPGPGSADTSPSASHAPEGYHPSHPLGLGGHAHAHAQPSSVAASAGMGSRAGGGSLYDMQGTLGSAAPAAAAAGSRGLGPTGMANGAAGTGAAFGAPGGPSIQALLAEKDNTIAELKETIEILELKIKKMEQLVRLKDSRIQTLTSRLNAPVGY